MSWLAASGRLNWLRSNVYCLAICRHASAAPRAPQAMPYLALVRQPNAPFSPSTLGKTASAGILTLSISTIPVVEARRENLPCITGVSNPVPFSFLFTMNPRTLPSSHLAQIIKISAIGELVILNNYCYIIRTVFRHSFLLPCFAPIERVSFG